MAQGMALYTETSVVRLKDIDTNEEDEQVPADWNLMALDPKFCRRFWHSTTFQLLERKCYIDLRTSINTAFSLGCGMVIVLGNPGIGKTGLLIYYLAHLMQNGKRSIIFQTKDGTRFMYSRQNSGEYDFRRGTFGDELFNDPELYYLIDGGIDKTPPFLGHALLCCSPEHSNWSDAAKYGGRVILYMPVWSRTEIAIANQEIYKRPQAVVMADLKKWGGIPRYVLAETSDAFLTAAISGCADIEGVVRVACAGTAKVMHIQVVDERYQEYRYVWASDYVRQAVFAVLYTSQKAGLKSFLAFSANPALNSFKGDLLQLLCKSHFPRGGQYSVKRLFPDAHPSAPFQLHLPPRTLYEFNGLLKNAELPVSDQYIFWPNKKKQETFHFFWLETTGAGNTGNMVVKVVNAVQVTYSSKKDQHGLQRVGIQQLKDKFGVTAGQIVVHILTPAEMFADAGHQCWTTTKGVVSQPLLAELSQVGQLALAYEWPNQKNVHCKCLT